MLIFHRLPQSCSRLIKNRSAEKTVLSGFPISSSLFLKLKQGRQISFSIILRNIGLAFYCIEIKEALILDRIWDLDLDSVLVQTDPQARFCVLPLTGSRCVWCNYPLGDRWTYTEYVLEDLSTRSDDFFWLLGLSRCRNICVLMCAYMCFACQGC